MFPIFVLAVSVLSPPESLARPWTRWIAGNRPGARAVSAPVDPCAFSGATSPHRIPERQGHMGHGMPWLGGWGGKDVVKLRKLEQNRAASWSKICDVTAFNDGLTDPFVRNTAHRLGFRASNGASRPKTISLVGLWIAS